jgi:hypothetical protein
MFSGFFGQLALYLLTTLARERGQASDKFFNPIIRQPTKSYPGPAVPIPHASRRHSATVRQLFDCDALAVLFRVRGPAIASGRA